MLILLTDGQQTFVPDAEQPETIAKELAREGVDVFSIGIGEEIDRVELESLISKKEHIFFATDLTLLIDMLVEEISQALICEGTHVRVLRQLTLMVCDLWMFAL